MVLLLFRKVFLLSILGLAAVVLVGPVVAVVATLLPFALVGFAVWFVGRSLAGGRLVAWATAREAGQRLYRGVVVAPGRLAGRGWQGAKAVAHGTTRGLMRFAGFTGRVFFEGLAGASVGGILGAIGGGRYGDADIRVPLGLAAGALIGVLVALFWHQPARKPTLTLAGRRA
jgi:hypothetical protein